MPPSRVFTVIALALSLGGCAGHRAILEPEPVTGPPPAAASEAIRVPSLESYIAELRELSRKARPNFVRTGLATVESSNPDVAAALAALTVFPSAQRHIEVAEAYRRARVLDKAHEHLALAARLDPRNARAYDEMARIWRDWGFPNMAIADAHRAVYFAPASPAAHNTLGTVFQGLGRYDDAEREYERVLSIDPRAAYARNNLCALALAEGRPDIAAAECQEALKIAPGLAVAAHNLARANALLAAPPPGADHERH